MRRNNRSWGKRGLHKKWCDATKAENERKRYRTYAEKDGDTPGGDAIVAFVDLKVVAEIAPPRRFGPRAPERRDYDRGKQENKKIQMGLSGFPVPARSSGRAYLMAAREPLLH